MKKIDIMTKCFQTPFRTKISEKVLKELLDNNDFDHNKKLEILQQVRQVEGAYIPQTIIKKILFDLPDDSKLTAEEKLKNYFTLWTDGSRLMDFNKIYDLYVQSGKFSEEKFPKREIFIEFIKSLGSEFDIKMLESRIDEIKYRQIGNYYQITVGHGLGSEKIYDDNGNIIKPQNLRFNARIDENIKDSRDVDLLSNCVQEEKLYNLTGQIKERFEQYIKLCKNKNVFLTDVFIIGNILQLICLSWDREIEIIDFFSIDVDGNLKQIEVR